MPDRLEELLRQRALIQEHLAWLEQEITAAKQGSNAPPLPAQAKPLPQSIPTASPSTSQTTTEAEIILGQFQREASLVQTDTRRGCLIFFFIAMALLTLGLAIGYYFYCRHLGRWW